MDSRRWFSAAGALFIWHVRRRSIVVAVASRLLCGHMHSLSLWKAPVRVSHSPHGVFVSTLESIWLSLQLLCACRSRSFGLGVVR